MMSIPKLELVCFPFCVRKWNLQLCCIVITRPCSARDWASFCFNLQPDWICRCLAWTRCDATVHLMESAALFRYRWCGGLSQNACSSSAACRRGCRNYGQSPNTAASQSCSPVSYSHHILPSLWYEPWGRKESLGIHSQHTHVQLVFRLISVSLPHSTIQCTGTCSGVYRTPPFCLHSGCGASSGWNQSSKCRVARDGRCYGMSAHT